MDISNGERFMDMPEAYPRLARALRSYGQVVSPRGQETRELLDWSFVLERPHDSLPLGVGRKLSLPFAAVEAAQLISGRSRPELVTRINPTMARFIDDGKQHGAYGPRVGPYLEKLLLKLKSDQDTRQAILTVWSPRHDYVDTVDVPCTLSLHFVIRNNRLVLMTTMRSNDIWWGTAYDAFQFTQLQLTVAKLLGVEPGDYHHRANSLHLYARDYDAVDQLHSPDSAHTQFLPNGIDGGNTMGGAMVRAETIMKAAYYRDKLQLFGQTESETWYHEQLLYESPRV